MEDKNIINELNALIQCNPNTCVKSNCPLFYEEQNCCDASRFIRFFSTIMEMKFENIKTFKNLSE